MPISYKLLNHLILFSCILCAFRCAVVPAASKYQLDYFPGGIDDVYLGMTYEFLEKSRKETTLDFVRIDEDSTRSVYNEKKIGKPYESVTYFIDNGDESILYEMSVNFPQGTDVGAEAVKMYGETNSDGGEWAFDTPEGFRSNMWQTPAKLFISSRELRQNP